MYLFAQMAAYLLAAFLSGICVGYALWRAWGDREVIDKYQAAERRLAEYIAEWQNKG